MASVKRYRHVGSRIMETIEPNDGEYVLASDYDSLEKRAEKLELELNDTRELLKCTLAKQQGNQELATPNSL